MVVFEERKSGDGLPMPPWSKDLMIAVEFPPQLMSRSLSISVRRRLLRFGGEVDLVADSWTSDVVRDSALETSFVDGSFSLTAGISLLSSERTIGSSCPYPRVCSSRSGATACSRSRGATASSVKSPFPSSFDLSRSRAHFFATHSVSSGNFAL